MLRRPFRTCRGLVCEEPEASEGQKWGAAARPRPQVGVSVPEDGGVRVCAREGGTCAGRYVAYFIGNEETTEV